MLFVYGSSNNQGTETNAGSAGYSANDSSMSSADSVNISQLVAAQIQQARDRQLSAQAVTAANQTKLPQVKTIKTVQAVSGNSPIVFQISYDTMMKILILGSASVMAVLVVFIRRKRYNKKFNAKKSFKDNIKSLREEKLFVKNNPKLSEVRNKLGSSPSIYNYSKEGVSNAARDLNISKGEILLAAKIKAHELSKTWPSK